MRRTDLAAGAGRHDALIARFNRHRQFARPAFTVYAATPHRDSAVIGFPASTAVADATHVYLRYNGTVGGGTDNHMLKVGVRFSW